MVLPAREHGTLGLVGFGGLALALESKLPEF